MNSSVIIVLLVFVVVTEGNFHTYSLTVPSTAGIESIMSPLEPSRCWSSVILGIRGGSTGSEGKEGKKTTLRRMIAKRALGLWGVLQVVSIIGNAIKRLLPIAMQPFQENGLLPYQWAMYIVWSAYMVYMEGYKSFQSKFSPMVAKRAFKLVDHPSPLNVVLAGPFSMGMIDATNRRKKISWGVTIGVFGLVHVVKKLPYPYRSIVDAGVVAGLSYGTATILYFATKALLGFHIDMNPDFPEDAEKGVKKVD
jgi:hypothetical protein